MLTNKQLRKTLDEIEWLKKYYNKHFAVEAKPVTGEYDKKLRTEMRAVVERINSDVDKAVEPITLIDGKQGRPFLTERRIIEDIPEPKPIDGKTYWLWVFTTENQTIYTIQKC